MAKQRHAAATEVTVAPLAESVGFEKFVQSHWKHGVALCVLIVAVVIGTQWYDQQQRSALTTEWSNFNAVVRSAGGTSDIAGTPDQLRALAGDPTKTSAPWALLALASKLEGEGNYASANEALSQLEREHPTHSLVRDTVIVGDEKGTLVGLMKARVSALEEFAARSTGLFSNPEPPADARRVRLSTSKGDIVVALYDDRAPKHADNFVGLAERGEYNGTKFHRVIDGFMVQGGDLTSINGPPETWGTGDAGYTIPQEFSELVHFAGYVAAAKKPTDVESGGHQFYITLGPAHHLDKVHTVFGKVVEGMDVVRAIGSAPNQPNSDRPLEPVVLNTAERL